MNWYRLAQLEPPSTMNYMDIGHANLQGGYSNHPDLNTGVTKECLWLIGTDWKFQMKCEDPYGMDEYGVTDEAGFRHSHPDIFDRNVLKNIIASGRYVEYKEKEPVVSMMMEYSLLNDPTGPRKAQMAYKIISECFNTDNIYEFK